MAGMIRSFVRQQNRPVPVGVSASKEDLQKAFGEVKVEIADLRGELKSEIANFRAAMETRFNDKFASLDRGMAVLKFAYRPLIMGLLIKLAFFD